MHRVRQKGICIYSPAITQTKLRKNTGILHLLFFQREKYLTKPAL